MVATRDEVAARLARMDEEAGGEWAFDEVFAMAAEEWGAFWRRFAVVGGLQEKPDMARLAADALSLCGGLTSGRNAGRWRTWMRFGRLDGGRRLGKDAKSDRLARALRERVVWYKEHQGAMSGMASCVCLNRA